MLRQASTPPAIRALRPHRGVAVAGALLAGGLALVGCGSSASGGGAAPAITPVGSGTAPAGDFTGATVTPAIQPPVGTFAATDGETAYDLATAVRGRVTLVYFGYTECPDVCPTTMAALGAALRSLPAATDAAAQVVFVTSDPKHDTPAVMKAWLGDFDDGVSHPFLGLSTDFPTVQRYASDVGVELDDPVTDAAGKDTDSHGAQVLAFSPDGEAHIVWLPGTTVPQYAADITKLVAGRT